MRKLIKREQILLKEFEKQLIDTIDTSFKNIKVSSYLGEFENIKEFEKCVKNVPLILVGFESERYINLAQKEATYKIYFVNATQNKDEIYRQKAKFEVLDLLERVDEILRDSKLCNEFRIELEGAVRVYEGISDYGYLSIFSRQIKTKMQEFYLGQDELGMDEI